MVVQTYSPEHYAIQAASRHDYEAFYEREAAFRRQKADQEKLDDHGIFRENACRYRIIFLFCSL